MTKLIPRLARRKKRVSANIRGTADAPRVAIYRSNRFVYSQAIDDVARKTLASANTVKIESTGSQTKTASAKECGSLLAKILKEKGISKAIIDRSRFNYLGRVMSFVDGLREGGIQV